MVEITSSHEEDSLHGESLPPPPDMDVDNDVIEEHVGGVGGEVSTGEGGGFSYYYCSF